MSNLERNTERKLLELHSQTEYTQPIIKIPTSLRNSLHWSWNLWYRRCLSRKIEMVLKPTCSRLLIAVRTGDDGTYKSFTTISPWNWKNGDGGELSNKALVPFPEFASDTEESWEERNSRSALGSLPTFLKSNQLFLFVLQLYSLIFSVIKDSTAR